MAVSKANGARPSTLSFAPDNQQQLLRGVSTLEQTLGPTLGPNGHAVACARIGRPGQPPELLDDGATIARRMIGLPDRFANMGFMTARHVAWRMHAIAHDGATTAVVLLAAAYREFLKLQAAGINRAELNTGATRFVEQALGLLDELAEPLSQDDAMRVAATMARDPRIAEIVVQAADLLGPDAPIVARAAAGRTITADYIEGALWESTAVMSPLLAETPTMRLDIHQPRVLLWDGDLDDPHAFATALGRLRSGGARAIVTIARSFSRQAIALLVANASPEFQLFPVIAPHEGAEQAAAFGDLAALTGSRLLTPIAGDSLVRLNPADVGSAARVSTGARFLNLLATEDRAPAIETRLAAARTRMAETENDREWKQLQLRLGRLQQRMAVIWVGAATEAERDSLLAATERTLAAVRTAQTGVVPGGGKSLIEIAQRLTGSGGTLAADPVARSLARACAALARWLAKNGGFAPEPAIATARSAEPWFGIDARTGELVDLRMAGIVDAVSTTKLALQTAISAAVLLADTALLIHRPISLSMAEIKP